MTINFDLRGIFKKISKIDLKEFEGKKPGTFENWFGTYWPTKEFDELCDCYKTIVNNCEIESEVLAAKYSLAGLLKDGLKLEDAKAICNELINECPSRKVAYLSILAFVEARLGNRNLAFKYASWVNEQNKPAFKVDFDLLEGVVARVSKP